MNRNLVIAVVVIVVLGLGYVLFMNKPAQPQPSTTTTPQEQVAPSPVVSTVTATLLEQNKSSESGTAVLVEENEKVKVTLNLTGAPKGVAQPAHIHVGACPDVGAVKYPLISPVDGVSETVLDVTLAQLRSELPLGINVHKSATQAAVYVSCADLAL